MKIQLQARIYSKLFFKVVSHEYVIKKDVENMFTECKMKLE